jgi:serine/threonine-protein kinase RsbW
MFVSIQPSSSREPLAVPAAPSEWQRERLVATEQVSAIADRVVAAMETVGYSGRDVFGVRLALEEAVVNAIKHGHNYDTSKEVRIRFRVKPERVLIEVEDEGEGFDPHQVPDPRTPENLERPGGRGLLLMRSYLTWLRYNERGNVVTLCKCRSLPQREGVSDR